MGSTSAERHAARRGKSDYIWDADRIFRQISECAVKALEGLNAGTGDAATITTFGVDGALVDEAGNLLYPVSLPGNAPARRRS